MIVPEAKEHICIFILLELIRKKSLVPMNRTQLILLKHPVTMMNITKNWRAWHQIHQSPFAVHGQNDFDIIYLDSRHLTFYDSGFTYIKILENRSIILEALSFSGQILCPMIKLCLLINSQAFWKWRLYSKQ